MSRVHRARSGATRQAILDACNLELSENGYSSTSMDAIAARAGTSKMSVYYHYESKDALCVEALTAKMSGLRQELRDSISGFETSGEALQHAAGIIWRHFSIMGRSIYTLIDEIRRVNPELLAQVEAAIIAYNKVVRDIVREGQDRGEIVEGNPSILTHLFVSAVGATIQWYDPKGGVPPAAFVRLLQSTTPRLLIKPQAATSAKRPAPGAPDIDGGAPRRRAPAKRSPL